MKKTSTILIVAGLLGSPLLGSASVPNTQTESYQAGENFGKTVGEAQQNFDQNTHRVTSSVNNMSDRVSNDMSQVNKYMVAKSKEAKANMTNDLDKTTESMHNVPKNLKNNAKEFKKGFKKANDKIVF